MKTFIPAQTAPDNFWNSLGLPPPGSEALFEELHAGLHYRVFQRLNDALSMDQSKMAKVVDIKPATLNRRKGSRFTREESDRLYRLLEVVKAAKDLFEGDLGAATAWLCKPVRGLGDRRPIDMVITTAETQAVLDLIGRLEYGIVS